MLACGGLLAWAAVAPAQELQTTSVHPIPVLRNGRFVAEMTGNAYPDLVAVHAVGSRYYLTVAVDFGLNPGRIAKPRYIQDPAIRGASYVVPHTVFDENGDGLVDLLLRADSTNYVMHSLGGGAFGALTPVGIPQHGWTNMGDLDGDGRDDLLGRVNGARPLVQLWLNRSTGWVPSRAIAGYIRSHAIGDFNGDGFADYAILQDGNRGRMQVMLGDAQGTMAGTRIIDLGTAPLDAFIWHYRDFDGDGRTDVVASDFPAAYAPASNLFFLVQGDPTQVLVRQADNPLPPQPFPNALFQGFDTWDVDGDGVLDMSCRWWNPTPRTSTLSLMRGNGAFGFGPLAFEWTAPIVFFSALYGDFDGDGDDELIAENDTFPPNPPTPLLRYVTNRAIEGAGSAGTVGVPQSGIGLAIPGNPSFAFSLSNALPNAPAGLLLSVGAGAVFVPRLTDAGGTAALPLRIPRVTSVLGAIGIQWFVLDPQAAPFAGLPLAMTPTRNLRIF